MRDRVVHLGIELDADGVDALESLFGEGVEQQSPRLVQRLGLFGRRVREVRGGEVEGVEHRQHLHHDLAGRAVGGVHRGTRHALAVVLEVGLQTLERVEVLVAFALDVGAFVNDLRDGLVGRHGVVLHHFVAHG